MINVRFCCFGQGDYKGKVVAIAGGTDNYEKLQKIALPQLEVKTKQVLKSLGGNKIPKKN